MKLSTLSSLFVLLSVVSMIAIAPSAFADVTVTNAPGSAQPGCEPDCFIPSTVTIEVGETVTWENNDTAAHTASGGNPTDGLTGPWDSSLIMAGGSFSYTADTAGTFDYFCMVHPWMEGTLIVEAAGAADAAAAEAAAEAQAAEAAAAAAAAAEAAATAAVIEAEPEIEPEPMMTSQPAEEKKGGGCLIATAAFGSEMAPQVQFLREIRDNTVLQTESGSAFMTGFNQFYYSFSPAVADYERENPAFKETVKLALTPMLSSLAILNYVDIDSESEMLGYGIGIILLNIGMYFVAPAIIIIKIKNRN